MNNPSDPPQFSAELLSSLDGISASEWNSIAGTDYPFTRHEFLHGMETTGCTTAESGWQPCHLILRRDDALAAVMPMYLKSHSYGEYVFDWSWSDAWRNAGLEYYPKLLTAIPFTPATGQRLCVSDDIELSDAIPLMCNAVEDFSKRRQLSSWHVLFPEKTVSDTLLDLGMHRRVATQFHWFNQGYSDFEGFLSTFTSRKRKSLKRERRRVSEQGLNLKTLTGSEITEADWEQFYHFYQLTYAKRSGHGGYLSKAFFTQTAASMGEQVVMILAYEGARPVAGALCFRSSDTLYGRYWGCEQEFDCLHFEACYYQGIEYCINHKLDRFDPGAQGEHKIQRGFTPVPTWSNHWIADPRLSEAVGDFTRREAAHIDDYKQAASELLPFKENAFEQPDQKEPS
jgi:predicted N-acyltransferase